MQHTGPLCVCLLGLSLLHPLGASRADEIEPLPADFLDYLASFEGEGDDWTLFEAKRRKKPKHESDKRQHHPATHAPAPKVEGS